MFGVMSSTERSVDWKSALEMQVHLQYTLFNPNTRTSLTLIYVITGI